ncbi:MAG: hypothetical protein DRN92_00065 [Thermoproteota archaeon]|nr:MAG: hypothetical protein DRN92_00065 [Candidatus Korarchaeota archaeon]
MKKFGELKRTLKNQVSLIIECKKSSEHPWVFFTNEKGREFDFPQFLVKSWGNPRIHKDFASQERWMRQSHYFNEKIKKKAIIGYEAFKEKGKRGGKIFEASMQVIKAISYQLRRTVEVSHYMPKNALFIKYPVIVFDGHLFEYTLEELKPTKYLQYLVRRSLADPLIRELVGDLFLIDVLTTDFLPEYLEMVKKEIDSIKHELISWVS